MKPRDVLIANELFGPDVGALKGKTTRRTPPIVDLPISVDLTSILKHYGEITLCVDLMYVNKVPLLVTLSWNIKFGTMEAVADRKEATMLKCIKGVASLYRKAGFKVTTALMDGEFMLLRGGLAELGLRLNKTSRDEHVGDIEQYIQTVKERMRAIYNTLPFQKIPAWLVIEMAKTAVFWLNAFPAAGGASQDLSPCTILTGQQVDCKRHCRFQFGEYTQTHEEHNNSMNPRTVGAIALRPVGNSQGSFYFLSITAGRVLNRLHATALQMPDEVIDKIHRMARQQKNNPGLIFADQNLNLDEYDDDEDDEMYHDEDSTNDDDEDVLNYDEEEDNDIDENLEEAQGPPEEEDNDVDEDEEEAQGPPAEENDAAAEPLVGENNVDADNDDNNDDVVAEADVQQPVEVEHPGDPANLGDDDDDDDDEADLPEIQGVDEEVINSETPGVGMVGENGEDKDEEEAINQPPPVPCQGNERANGRYNLHNTRGHDCNHQYARKDFIIDSVAMTTHGTSEVLEMPQMSLKAGLRTFGNDGVRAVEKEMRQLHDRGVMMPVHKKSLTLEQQKEALAYLMFLKQKRCGKVKGRGCADGRKQRAYIAKEESTAPMVSTEAVFLTTVIDALENREVAVLDVPGAFMQADIDELVHVRFTGEMVNMLLHIDNNMYKDYVVMGKGEKVMYMELLKALCGTLRAARLFWQKLSKQLIEVWGFTPNKYDDCMVNETINGHQMTVVWHVDDLKVSHVDGKEVDKFIMQMEETFSADAPLSVSRGKIHDYLGMNLDFCVKGEVWIDMEHYIDMMLLDAPEDMEGVSNTPAAAHLFKTNLEDPKLLGDKQKKIFVHLVMHGLYLSQ